MSQRSTTKRKRNPIVRRKRVLLFFRLLFIGFIVGLFLGIQIGRGISSNSKSENTELSSSTDEIGIKKETKNKRKIEEPKENVSSNEHVTERETIIWNSEWTYASFSEIHESAAILYRSTNKHRKNIVVAVNAGHGTIGGNQVKTLCHPDGSLKVTGGSTAAGEQYAAAISSGMTFLDGTEEATATLSLALLVKEQLLDEGYDVLMLRESDDCRLDNIARTVFANENADCHISLHYDSSENDKGFFYISVPENEDYRSMEPVCDHWKDHDDLGEALLEGIKKNDIKVFSLGSIEIDLTQTSYSTIPSVDIEVGDRGSDHSEKMQDKIAKAIVNGVDYYFENR